MCFVVHVYCICMKLEKFMCCICTLLQILYFYVCHMYTSLNRGYISTTICTTYAFMLQICTNMIFSAVDIAVLEYQLH